MGLVRPIVQIESPGLRGLVLEVGVKPSPLSLGRELPQAPHPRLTMRRSRPGLST